MKRKMVALLFGVLLVLSTAVTAVWADGNDPANPGPATTGYEGQPGNQAGSGGGDPAPPPPPGEPAPGLLGYEGQPGNQGG